MHKISFWKPSDCNENELTDELLSIGTSEDVMKRIARIPHMKKFPTLSSNLEDSTVKFLWQQDRGIFIYFNSDPDDLIRVVHCTNFATNPVLYRFYVLMYEHFDVMLLDEQDHRFYSVKDFKKKIVKE